MNERLAQTPELYVLAIAQFALTAPDDHMRAFSLVLLRRLLFRSQPTQLTDPPPSPSQSPSSSTQTQPILYDRLSEPTRHALERALLHALLAEPSASVKHKASDAITDVANASFTRGRPWPQLSDALFKAMGADAVSRESAWRVIERCTVLSSEIPPDFFVRGLADPSVEVRLAAVKAATAALSSPSNSGVAQTLLARSLSTLPTAPHSHLTRFLNALTPLASSHPSIFAPHLQDLLRFLPSLIFNKKEYDAGPTPTVSRPFPSSSGGGGAFQFPPPPQSRDGDDDDGEMDEEEEETQQIRLAALELMVSLSEAKPSMVRRVEGWVASLVRACLEGMGELVDTEAELESWLEAEVRIIPGSRFILLLTIRLTHTSPSAVSRSDGHELPTRIRTVTRPALARAAGQTRPAHRVPVHPVDARESRLASAPRGSDGDCVYGRGRRTGHAERAGQGRQVSIIWFSSSLPAATYQSV